MEQTWFFHNMLSVWHPHSCHLPAMWYAYVVYMAKPYSCHMDTIRMDAHIEIILQSHMPATWYT